MQFVQQGNTLTVLITNPHKIEPERLNISPLLILHAKDRNRLLNATSQYAVGNACQTQHRYINEALRPFGYYLHWDTALHQGSICRLPDTFEGWQRLVLQFALWYISRPGTKASLETLCKNVQCRVRPWLEFLQEDGLIPLGVMLPDLSLPEEQGSHGSPQNPRLLGEQPAKPTRDDEPIEKVRKPLDRTLAGPIFWHIDAEYLDQVEATLRNRDQVLADLMDDYWLRLVRDYRCGQQMLQQITADDWRLREQNAIWKDDATVTIVDTKGRHYQKKISLQLTSPRHPKGHLWGLRMMMQQLKYSNDPECLTPKALRKHPACLARFLKNSSSTPIAPLLSDCALPLQQAELLSSEQLFYRFLGLLNTTDMAVAKALLIREHANLTPDALDGAQLLNVRGKSYMLLTDEGQQQIFSVDKPRAGSRKYAALTPRAARVLRHLQRATAPVRALLKRAGHPHWRYLLLGVTQVRKNINGLGHPARIYAQLLYDTTGKYKFTLARCHPTLTNAGLGAGTLDFNKIRHTQGVLAWFDKGSVRAVQKRLGNSYRVAIEHYIPEPLIQIWNERIIRRFQNTLLVLAAAEEDYLLEVVDMPNLAELHRFLAQLVYELPAGSSPIADKLHQLYAERYRIDHAGQPATWEAVPTPDDLLHLRLSPNSLALLLAYRQWAQQHLTASLQIQPDHLTGLTPKHFIDLGGMLQAAAQSDDIGYALRESLNVKKLQRVYGQAESKVPILVNRLTHLSLQPIYTEDIP
ncbi:hypothetical protein [Photobacterium alginatilyticum]|uniref:Uncharacterized protein n=1 Tax=Photobacterium alginatilyticum TaxID=1775171 RepID=A0ABW9YMW9_9GAMM|nr:hypothetical protein [Photobacterium alginatilyticum]NBI54576.1 hypothetical protein [Photobacterium alginatilyticum]